MYYRHICYESIKIVNGLIARSKEIVERIHGEPIKFLVLPKMSLAWTEKKTL